MVAPPVSTPDLLNTIRTVIDGPLPDVAVRLSRFLTGTWPHTALVIFTLECTGRPRKVSGDRAIVERVGISELENLRRRVSPGAIFDGHAVIAQYRRRVWALLDTTDTLLVVVPKPQQQIRESDLVRAVFGLVADSIRHRVIQASPDYLAESRAASSERSRTIIELSEVHAATLESILATLRSTSIDDHRSRMAAIDAASAALVKLRSAGHDDRIFAEEPVTTAFAKLRGDLRPLLQHRAVRVDYVDPPAAGRALPGEVAHAARAIVHTIALAFTAQPVLDRIRIAWNYDSAKLLIEVRDDGRGGLDTEELSRQLSGRVHMLAGSIGIESVDDWGSRVTVVLPLDPPETRSEEQSLVDLSRRELDVLAHLATGKRNKAIADTLGISDSTVKFHVVAILKKLGVNSRGEAAAIAREAGVYASSQA